MIQSLITHFHWDIACILALSLSWIHDKGLSMGYGYLVAGVLGIGLRGGSEHNITWLFRLMGLFWVFFLLDACRLHTNIELAEESMRNIWFLAKMGITYVVLSNVYVGDW
jgi:hypothetical protein